MTGIAANIGLGVLTNVIYDISKYVCSKFFTTIKEKDVRDLVEKRISETLPEDLRPLFESSTFVTYFSSPQFLDIINAYIEHKIICNNTRGNTRIQKYSNKKGMISVSDLTNHITDYIYKLYIENEVLVVPTKADIGESVSYIIEVTECIISQSLSPESSRMIYFLNSRADKHYSSIIDFLESLKNTIESIKEKDLVAPEIEYKDICTKYYDVLKNKNSEAHIYTLDKFPFEKFYVPPILQRFSSDKEIKYIYEYADKYSRFTSWNDIFQRNNIVYLTGGAGYGKSLFTKKIINNYTDLNIFHSDEYIVIYGELKAFYPNNSDTPISVIDFLKDSIKNSTLIDVSSDFIKHFLNSGRCIILLDALDEVDKFKRDSLHESVVAFFKSQNPNNKICITSRDRGFIPEKDVEVFSICPLTWKQIEKYVDKIIALKKFEESDKEAFMTQSMNLVNKGFLNSFLVLSLLISIYKAERELPENKLELYQKCFEYIANKREKEKTQKEFNWNAITPIMKDNTFIELSRMGLPNNSNIDRNDIKERLLKVYHAKYACEADAENAIDEFLDFCSDRTELFVPTSEDKFRFFHRSFFEYFYSLYISLRCNSENDVLEELLKFDIDSEVFELTVAMLKQKNEEKYQALIELLLKNAYEELIIGADKFHNLDILILSMQVIDDALYKKKFLDILISHKATLIKNTDNIHNLRLISNIFSNDIESCQSIYLAYENDFVMYLFNNLDKLFKLNDEYSKDHEESIFDKMISGKALWLVEDIDKYHIVDYDKYFYVLVLSESIDCVDLILNTTDDTLLNTYKEFSPRNYRKKTATTRNAIEKFREFSRENQEKVVQYFLTNPFIFW